MPLLLVTCKVKDPGSAVPPLVLTTCLITVNVEYSWFVYVQSMYSPSLATIVAVPLATSTVLLP